MKIPVTYNKSKVGEVTVFNKDTGEITVSLDMSKEESKLIESIILNDVPISMSIKNEPSKRAITKTNKSTDMANRKCENCTTGRDVETSIHDDIDGVLHCNECGVRVERHQLTPKGLPYIRCHQCGILTPAERTHNGVCACWLGHCCGYGQDAAMGEETYIDEDIFYDG